MNFKKLTIAIFLCSLTAAQSYSETRLATDRDAVETKGREALAFFDFTRYSGFGFFDQQVTSTPIIGQYLETVKFLVEVANTHTNPYTADLAERFLEANLKKLHKVHEKIWDFPDFNTGPKKEFFSRMLDSIHNVATARISAINLNLDSGIEQDPHMSYYKRMLVTLGPTTENLDFLESRGQINIAREIVGFTSGCVGMAAACFTQEPLFILPIAYLWIAGYGRFRGSTQIISGREFREIWSTKNAKLEEKCVEALLGLPTT